MIRWIRCRSGRPDPAVTAQGEALHQHLKDLGIPADAAAGILTRIEGALDLLGHGETS